MTAVVPVAADVAAVSTDAVVERTSGARGAARSPVLAPTSTTGPHGDPNDDRKWSEHRDAHPDHEVGANMYEEYGGWRPHAAAN